MNMEPPTVGELRSLAASEDRGASFHQTQLDHSRLKPSERLIEEKLKRKARIYAHALREWADRLEEQTKPHMQAYGRKQHSSSLPSETS